MLVTSDIEQISQITGKTVEEINSAITGDEQVELGIAPKIEELRTNVRGAGVEIGIKQVCEEFGINSVKSPDKAKEALTDYFQKSQSGSITEKEAEIQALKERIEKGDSNAKDAEEFKRKYETIKGTYEKEKKDYETKIQEINNSIFTKERENMILSVIPDNTIIGRDDLSTLIKSTVKIEKNEHGGFVVLDDNGMPKQDALGNTLAADQYIKNMITEKYLKKGESAPGGEKNGNPGSKVSFDEKVDELKAKGIDPGSEEGKLALAETL